MGTQQVQQTQRWQQQQQWYRLWVWVVLALVALANIVVAPLVAHLSLYGYGQTPCFGMRGYNGPNCANNPLPSVPPLLFFIGQLPLLSLILLVGSLLIMVVGLLMRDRGQSSARRLTLITTLRLFPLLVLIVMGILSCVLTFAVWLPAQVGP